MGTGIFYGLIPETITAKLSGVELDSISGRIAKQLYQDADIRVITSDAIEMFMKPSGDELANARTLAPGRLELLPKSAAGGRL